MSDQQIKTLLVQLKEALEGTDQVDGETLELVRQLNTKIDAVIDSSEPNSELMDDAIALEARFASTHPTAVRVLRELIFNLGRIGI